MKLCNGVSICEYEAHWQMDFSLIDWCGTHENKLCGHSFFWSDTYEFTNILIVTKNVDKQV